MSSDPADPAAHEVTVLLRAWRAGDQAALDALMPLVYRELHRMAVRHMSGERAGADLAQFGDRPSPFARE